MSMAENIIAVSMSEENYPSERKSKEYCMVLVEEGSLKSVETRATSFVEFCYNASGTFLGIGMLTVPYALSKGGWLGLLFFSLTALTALYTTILLKRCMEAAKTPIASYHDIAQKAFGRKWSMIVYIATNLEIYIIAVGLLILEADNLHKLFPHFAFRVGEIIIGGKPLFVMITTLAILPSILPSKLGIISYITAIGLFSTIVVVVAVICVGAKTSKIGFHHDNGKTLLAIGGIPTSVSLFIACFGGHPVVPTLYASMQNKGYFTKAMVVSFSFDTLVYLSLALVGYLMYGSKVESQITLNLPTKLISSRVAIYATLVIPITKYSLTITPVANALQIGPLLNKGLPLRIVLLFSTAIIACVFPYFDTLMAVVGSMFVVLTSFIFPCCCYLKISNASQKTRSYEYWGIVGIIGLSSFVGITGTYSSIAQLARK